MKPVAVAFSGGIKSGKSSLSSELAARLNWPRVSFGDRVRTVAQQAGLDAADRDVLQQLGELLVQKDAPKFCADVLAQADAKWTPGEGIILDGLRHAEVVTVLRAMLAPMDLCIILVSTDKKIRESRLPDSAGSSALAEWEKHPMEIQVTDILPLIADFVVDGSLSITAALDRILGWLTESDKI